MHENLGETSQTTNDVLMVRPAKFCFNPETFESNPEQVNRDAAAAIGEFDTAVQNLRAAGVNVTVIPDTVSPVKPDAIFPNNWFSTHEDGRVVLYPMRTPNRRLERRIDVIASLERDFGFKVSEVVDLSQMENDGEFLEGTGSLVLDRANKIAYASFSQRTTSGALAKFGEVMGYTIVPFHTDRPDGKGEIYHTNVVMSVCDKVAILCTAVIADPTEREAVLRSLASTNHEVIDITFEQMMKNFCGNVLEVEGGGATPNVLAMSESALNGFTPEQKAIFAAHGLTPVASNIRTIEDVGAGSMRCTMAEIHLPKK